MGERKKIKTLVLDNKKYKDREKQSLKEHQAALDAVNKEKEDLFEQLRLARAEIEKLKQHIKDQKAKIDELNAKVKS